MIIRYHDLATTWEVKVKVAEEREAKLKEEMTTLCKSLLSSREKVGASREHGWATNA